MEVIFRFLSEKLMKICLFKEVRKGVFENYFLRQWTRFSMDGCSRVLSVGQWSSSMTKGVLEAAVLVECGKWL